jgi:hypothetical protein
VIAAAKSGQTVVVPDGTWSFTTRLTVPAGVTLQGSGPAAWLNGPVSIAQNGCKLSGLRIGARGYSTYIGGVTSAQFANVEFCGGAGTFSSTGPCYNSNTVSLGSGSASATSGVIFTQCTFDTPMGSENAAHSLHMDSTFIEHCVGATFTDCTWEPSIRFAVEIYDTDSVGTRNLLFDGCTFNDSVSAHIDFATSSGGYSTVRDCTFLGNGVGPNPAWWDNITIEGGASNVTVTGCNALRGGGLFVAANEGPNTVTNNTVNGDSSCAHSYNVYIGMNGNGNVCTGNTIDSIGPDSQVIAVSGNGNIVTGNKVTTPLAAASAISVSGTGNTASPNTVQ